MKRAFLSVSFIALLAACDGNPLDPLPGDANGGGFTPGEGGADNAPGDNCGETGVVCSGEVNIFTFDDGGDADPTNDTVTINNLPFDLDGIYTYVGVVNGFTEFTNPAGAEVYHAFYRQGAETGAGVVATDGYADFGYGGVVVRTSGATLPTVGQATFSGPYVGMRVSDLGSTTDPAPVFTVVTGDAGFRVDFEDFDVTDAIEGFVINRVAVDDGGAALPNISIATTGFDGIQIATTSAIEVVGPDESGATGTFSGVFGGDVGSGSGEIAGFILLQGPNFLDEDFQVLERGAVVAGQDTYIVP